MLAIDESESQTPDTSDHSGDEYKVDRKSLSSVWSTKYDDILISLLNQPIPFVNIVFKFSTFDWQVIARKVSELDGQVDWVRKVLIYIYLYHPDVSDWEVLSLMPQTNTPGRLIKRYKSLVSSDIVEGWNKSDLEILHALHFYDLTRSGIIRTVPHLDISECMEIIESFANRIYYTEKEVEYILKNKNCSVEYLAEELVFRSEQSISYKMTQLNGMTIEMYKLNRMPSSNINSTAPESESRRKPGSKPGSKPVRKPGRKVENTEDNLASTAILQNDLKITRGNSLLTDEQRDNLDKCINNDLTLSCLKSTFPRNPIGEIVRLIRAQSDSIPFTAGEKELIKSHIKNKTQVGECLHDFPVRDKEYVEARYKEYDFVSTRVKYFKTSQERLVYEARWAVMINNSSSSTTRSSRKRKLEEDLEEIQRQSSIITKPNKVELTPEEEEQKRIRREQNRAKLLATKERKRMEAIQKNLDLEIRRAAGLVRHPRRYTTVLTDLVSSSEYFQTVTGDKKKVEEGQKRKRVQADHYRPEIEEKRKFTKLKTTARQAEKKKLKEALRAQKKEEVKIRKKPGPKPKKKNVKVKEEYIEPPIEEEEIEEDPSSEPEEEEEEEDVVSPFDPDDINSDTLIPLNGRQLYVSSMYDTVPSVPDLNFVNASSNESSTDLMSPSKKIMTDLNDDILFVDNLAAEIVASHYKQYRDLPISFPPFLTPSGKINDLNEIKVRFFLYPQHCESFILAEPKSNELDPIYEIVKLFMIHYSLYFSHSEILREIITEDYCHKLENSIEENDFCEFMNIIDKWNMLMIKLSPNKKAVEEITSKGEDINAGPRSVYLVSQEINKISDQELKLETFYGEIMLESISPSFQLVRKLSFEEKNLPVVEVGPGHAIAPINVSEEVKDLKPENYEEALFKRFHEKTTMSRFTIQQILLRVYSRIVSTDSRKLRSYKAFTAQVYGELLPSFTSEVLEKVNLQPTQKFYDLGSGVGNTTFQAGLEFGACLTGGCELMEHASKLTSLQTGLIQKHLAVLGLPKLNLNFALSQSFVNNESVRKVALDCDVLIINNYLFDGELNAQVGRLLLGLRPGTKIISLRNFISPRYRATFDTVFDYFAVEKHEMSDVMSVSWTANKVPYYISTVQDHILPEYLGREESCEFERMVSPMGRTGSTTSESASANSLSATISPQQSPPQSPQQSPPQSPQQSPPQSPQQSAQQSPEQSSQQSPQQSHQQSPQQSPQSTNSSPLSPVSLKFILN
ncbi:Histone-lysine N-methyltransferase H3 lysine-79 specific [Spathaspora sp. JA1]|nr:Histone-lysine N-methyltransferase H3 lysine-79 specific [Spathaspora sp. JA1]